MMLIQIKLNFNNIDNNNLKHIFTRKNSKMNMKVIIKIIHNFMNRNKNLKYF